MFQNLALFPVPTAQKREGQKGQRVLSRTQPPRSTTSETTFIVQTLAKYSNVKSLSWNLIGKVFTKITKKRALLKSIFVIPTRVSFFQFCNIRLCHESFMEKGHFDLAEVAEVMTYTANIWTLISSLYFVLVVWSAWCLFLFSVSFPDCGVLIPTEEPVLDQWVRLPANILQSSYIWNIARIANAAQVTLCLSVNH